MTATMVDEQEWPAVEEAADARVLVVAAAGAVGVDLAVRSGVASLGGALCVLAVAVGLAGSGRIRNPHAVGALLLAPVFGVFVALRQSPWLVLLDLAAAAVCLAVAASFARGGSLLDFPAAELVVRAARAIAHGIGGAPFVASALPRTSGRRAAVVRGLALAVPLVFVAGGLLASADAVFASFFKATFDPASLIPHLVLWAVGAWLTGGLLRLASATAEPVSAGRTPRLGQVETCVVLGALVVLYAAFAVAQVVAASEGGRRVLRTAGLTYAEYARSGFFQLLAVAALTLLVLLVLDNGTRVVRMLSLAAVALTLLIVASAVRRLVVYEDAFGLTMLRLSAWPSPCGWGWCSCCWAPGSWAWAGDGGGCWGRRPRWASPWSSPSTWPMPRPWSCVAMWPGPTSTRRTRPRCPTTPCPPWWTRAMAPWCARGRTASAAATGGRRGTWLGSGPKRPAVSPDEAR